MEIQLCSTLLFMLGHDTTLNEQLNLAGFKLCGLVHHAHTLYTLYLLFHLRFLTPIQDIYKWWWLPCHFLHH